MLKEIYNWVSKPILEFLANIPIFSEKFIVFILIVILGIILGRILGTLTKIILGNGFKIDNILKNLELENALYGYSLTGIISSLVKWYIYIYFLGIGIEAMGFRIMNFVINSLNTLYKAIGVFLFGLYLSEFIKVTIIRANIKDKELIANTLKYIIVYIFFVSALQIVGLDVTIFLDLLRYFALAAAISFGAVFGISILARYKEEIERIIK